jgi:hypothetical protein
MADKPKPLGLEIVEGDKKSQGDGPSTSTTATPENLEMTVTIPRHLCEEALKDAKLWQLLWGEVIPTQALNAALELKGFILNDFKPVQNNDEMRACAAKMVELERSQPKLKLGEGSKYKPGVNPPNQPSPKEMRRLLKENGFTESDGTPL